MATISSPGIGSGLDVQSIVSQLVALEKAPLTTLQKKATLLNTKISAYGTVSSQVSTLRDAAAKLGGSSGWNAVKASSSNTSAVTVSAEAGTAAMSLSMEVSQLAVAQNTASGSVAAGTAIGTGTLTIELGGWSGGSFTAGSSAPVSISIGTGEDNLTSIAAKINDADAGVSAVVLKDSNGERLLLRSKSTGVENGFRITTTDDDGNHSDGNGLSRLSFDGSGGSGTTQTLAAQNARATINGVAVETASNTLSDTLPGMTLKLLQVTTSPVEIDVSIDQDSIRNNVQSFVDAYNKLNSTLTTGIKYDESTKSAGILQGDSTAVGLQNALRSMMRSTTAGSSFTTLSSVGLEFSATGTLSLNSDKFNAALEDLAGLKDLFTVDTGSTTTQGFGLKFEEFTKGILDTDGLLSNRTTALKAAVERNGDEQEKVNERAARAETRYLAMYNAMDAKVASYNSLNAFISQQITLWNNSSS